MFLWGRLRVRSRLSSLLNSSRRKLDNEHESVSWSGIEGVTLYNKVDSDWSCVCGVAWYQRLEARRDARATSIDHRVWNC